MGSTIALFLKDREYSLDKFIHAFKNTRVYTDKTEKRSRRLDLWYLSLKGLSHTEQLNLVKDKEKMHTDDSADQNSRHPTATASEKEKQRRENERRKKR
jgi:hypothetical protein